MKAQVRISRRTNPVLLQWCHCPGRLEYGVSFREVNVTDVFVCKAVVNARETLPTHPYRLLKPYRQVRILSWCNGLSVCFRTLWLVKAQVRIERMNPVLLHWLRGRWVREVGG